MSKMAGFPFKSYPRSWYQIAWSTDLVAGDVRPVKYFGKDFVMFRTESGKVVVMDAFCRHLGAHLGHGGEVSGENIACPFHGWKWSSEGANVEVPYSKQKKVGATMRTWPVVEKSGLVLIWFDPAGGPPDFEPPEVPEFEDPSYYPVHPHGQAQGKAAFPPQLMVENAIDWPHLIYVHKWDADKPQVHKIEDRGHSFYVESAGALDTPRGVAHVRVEIEAWTIGLIYSHLSGIRDMGFVASVIPIDDEFSEIRLTTAVRRKEGDTGDTPDGLATAMIAGQVSEVLGTRSGGDRDIWEHMQYQPNPALVREEIGGWLALRKWTDKHYADEIKPPPPREVESAVDA